LRIVIFRVLPLLVVDMDLAGMEFTEGGLGPLRIGHHRRLYAAEVDTEVSFGS
jgi:hypothetical protein